MYFTEAIFSAFMLMSWYIVFRFLFTKFITKESYNPFLIPNLIALLAVGSVGFVVNYYFVESPQQVAEKKNVAQKVASGQSFTAPEIEAVQKPLQVSVDFDPEQVQSGTQTEVVTKLARYVFSSYGAILLSMDALWQDGKIDVSVIKGDQGSCLVSLSKVTPVDYELVNVVHDEQTQTHSVHYKSRVDGMTVYKTFVVHDTKYQVDVKVSCDGIAQEQVRLLLTSPAMTEELQAIVNKSSSTNLQVQDITLSQAQSLTNFWFEPALFGFTTKFLTTFCFASSKDAVARTYLKKINDALYQAIFESKTIGAGQEISWSLYVGPKTHHALTAVQADLGDLMQYGWFNMIAKPMLQMLVYLREQTGSYGWAIILLTLLIKLLLLPFTLKGERSMKQQAEFEKKRQHLQQKYKHDKAALDAATAELINKHGFPMLSGCLPMLLNLPVFFALNKVLTSAIELHGASFAWLPDLSVADPYYILSVIVFVGMLASPMPTVDPRQWLSRIGMALFVGAFTAYLASGLVLFIVTNTLLGALQTYLVRVLSANR